MQRPEQHVHCGLKYSESASADLLSFGSSHYIAATYQRFGDFMKRLNLMLVCLALTVAACGDDTVGSDTNNLNSRVKNGADVGNDANNVNNDNNSNNANNANNANNQTDMGSDADIDMPSTVCGDGVVEGNEVCDGNQLTETCETLGFGGGQLSCASNCADYDTTSCDPLPTCGDNQINDNEVCDGTDLAGQTCELQGRTAGTLRCAANCGSFDLSSCGPADTCDGQAIDSGEVCDGNNYGLATCESLGFGPGALACSTDCQTIDTSGCDPTPRCGDGAINGVEVCDDTLLNAETCETQGFGAGTLGCAADCRSFDTSLCPPPPACNDGAINGAEVCDGQLLNGETCQSQGFGPGTLGCAANCLAYDTSQCDPPPSCGDGAINGNEVCEPGMLNGETCASQSAGVGTLQCASDCLSYDLTMCCTPDCSMTACGPDPQCGVQCGACNQGESCTNGQCVCVPETCQSVGAICGSLPDGCGGTITCGVCTNGEPCLNNSCGCGNILGSNTYVIDVPVADITFNVTLNGQPVTSANTNDSDEGRLILEDPETGERFNLPETANGSTMNYPTTRRLIPGFYNVYYGNGGTQTFWPINNQKLLIENLDLNSNQTVVIDVPVVDINFNVTLNGQPVTSANTNDSDEGVFRLVDPNTGETISLPETANGSTMNYPTTRRIIPGVYDIYYGNGGTQTFWPINNDHLIIENADLTTSGNFTIDVSTVDVQFDVTLNGSPVTTANTNDSDEGVFRLVDPTTGETMSLPETANGATMNYPTTRRIIGSVYDIYYGNGGTQTFWPINTNHKLVDAVELTISQTYVIDVATADVTFDVTLDGQPVTPANTNDSDEGVFRLEDPTTGDVFSLPETANGATMNYPTTRRIIPFTYRIYYGNGGTQTFWPINNNHLLDSAAQLTSTGTYTINVPTIDATFDVTLNGQPVTSANTNDSDEGVFVLEDNVTGERFSLPETANGATMNYPTTRRIIPAVYDIYYGNGGTQLFWPINTNHKLYDDRSLQTTSTYVIDVPVEDVTFEVTLNGQPVTPANTNDSDEGVFRLVDPTTDETINLPETANGATMNYPTVRRIIPASYDVYYGNGGTQTLWPINNNRKVGCFGF